MYNVIINAIKKGLKNSLYNNCINESLKTAREKYKNIISKNEFDTLLKIDNSKTYKWIEKICQFYVEGHNLQEITNLFNEYEKYYIFINNKDITNKTYDEMLSDIKAGKEQSLNTNKYKRLLEKERNKIYDKNNIIIYDIKNYDDIRIKAKSCKLCIIKHEYKFDAYILTGHKFLMIYNDNIEFTNDLSRLCCDIDNGKIWFFDKNDTPYDTDVLNDTNILANSMGGYTIFNDVINFIKHYDKSN